MADAPISIVMAIPDHPWTKATPDSAAVRIAMTVCEAGTKEGTLREVVREGALDTDTPLVEFNEVHGIINSNLTVGVDVSSLAPLRANEGLSSRGVALHGSGFIVTPQHAEHLGLGRRVGLDRHIRNYRNGRDLTSRPRGVMVIDLFGLEVEEVRRRFPEVYQHVLATVKLERDANNRASYRDNWWLFGEPRRELRPALTDLPRYIATVETAKHRVFQFLDASILPDNKLIAIGSADTAVLGVLSSSIHIVWSLRAGGWLGVGNDPVYVKSRCFDPFPFPSAETAHDQRVGAIAEELDKHRKCVLAEHPYLTLTGLYNVLEKLRDGTDPAALEGNDRRIFDDGLVLILKELHDRLDAAVADAYGWPANLSDSDILTRLVALNKQRAREEANGIVRWLRPDYQILRFGTAQQKAQTSHNTRATPAIDTKPAFPADDMAQTAAVMAALASATVPLDASSLATRFRQGRRVALKIGSVLGALQRMGFANSNDAGRSFNLSRAA